GALAAPAPAPGAVDPDRIAIHGRVLDPAGRPVAGAEVDLTRWHWSDRVAREPLARTQSDDRGAFILSYQKSDPRFRVDVERSEMWRRVTVVAFAEGFGPGWQDRAEVPAEEEALLQLVEDLPLRGRVIDLEGRPVAGVEVTASGILAAREGPL